MKTIPQILTAIALGLITSAMAAQAANIPISSVPFSITAPGTYVLIGNLSSGSSGINITTPVAGAVTIDFKGFTITVAGGNPGVFVNSGSTPNSYPLTIRNGTIQGGIIGIHVMGSFADTTVTNMILLNQSGQGAAGVDFYNLNFSTISNCIFQNGYYGIVDENVGNNAGGNSYNNNSFANTKFPIALFGSGNDSLKEEHCQFAPPPSKE